MKLEIKKYFTNIFMLKVHLYILKICFGFPESKMKVEVSISSFRMITYAHIYLLGTHIL